MNYHSLFSEGWAFNDKKRGSEHGLKRALFMDYLIAIMPQKMVRNMPQIFRKESDSDSKYREFTIAIISKLINKKKYENAAKRIDDLLLEKRTRKKNSYVPISEAIFEKFLHWREGYRVSSAKNKKDAEKKKDFKIAIQSFVTLCQHLMGKYELRETLTDSEIDRVARYFLSLIETLRKLRGGPVQAKYFYDVVILFISRRISETKTVNRELKNLHALMVLGKKINLAFNAELSLNMFAKGDPLPADFKDFVSSFSEPLESITTGTSRELQVTWHLASNPEKKYSKGLQTFTPFAPEFTKLLGDEAILGPMLGLFSVYLGSGFVSLLGLEFLRVLFGEIVNHRGPMLITHHVDCELALVKKLLASGQYDLASQHFESLLDAWNKVVKGFESAKGRELTKKVRQTKLCTMATIYGAVAVYHNKRGNYILALALVSQSFIILFSAIRMALEKVKNDPRYSMALNSEEKKTINKVLNYTSSNFDTSLFDVQGFQSLFEKLGKKKIVNDIFLFNAIDSWRAVQYIVSFRRTHFLKSKFFKVVDKSTFLKNESLFQKELAKNLLGDHSLMIDKGAMSLDGKSFFKASWYKRFSHFFKPRSK